MDQPKDWTPRELLETSGYYWRTCTLHAAVKLGVFSMVGNQPRKAADIADALGADKDATERLLNALCALGLLHREEGGYTGTEAGMTYLDRASPRYLGHMILHHHHLVESWFQLDQAVLSGAPVPSLVSFSEEQRRESFLMGMFNNAMLMAPRLVDSVNLEHPHRLLDLGGGPGTYAIHFCRKHPDLKATVFDLPTTKPFAEETVAAFHLSERIDFASGDYLQDELPAGYDVVWMSHILHAEGPESCRDILRKAVGSLDPGGRVLVHEFILDDTLDGPLFPALFSLNMLLRTASGRSYSESELRGLLSEAGVRDIRRLAFRGPTESGIMMGTI
jgi:ubiquinone/menaquinone biosynthesis C-methylase UbiE